MSSVTLTGYHAGYIVAAGVNSVEVASNGTVGAHGMYAKNSLTLENYGLMTVKGYYQTLKLEADCTIINHSTMSGWDTIDSYAPSGTSAHLFNYGVISGSGEAVDLSECSGILANYEGALITGHYGASLGSGYFRNLGTISVQGHAASIGTGNLVNGRYSDLTALIQGNYAASVGTGTLTNYGHILGGGNGVFVDDGAVINGSKYDRSALIQGSFAVEMEGAGASVVNFATILSLGKAGVYLWASGTLTNGAPGNTTASISGATGVINGRALTAANYGVITGWGGDGMTLSGGGAITNGSATDKSAAISGYAGVASSGTLPTYLTNFGSVIGTRYAGVSLGGGGEVLNGTGGDTHALISGAGGVIMGASGFVQNFGTISGNSGAGVALSGGGGVVNGGGVDTSALIEGYGGVAVSGAAGSVTNFGTIIGTGGLGHYGAYISVAGGTLINGSVNNNSALITGYGGVDLGKGATGVNFGVIRGAGDIGGDGALLVSGAALTNGAAGKPVAVIDGYEGVVTYGGAATFTNFGTVIGENGVAVQLAAQSDLLAVESGAVFIGAVNGGGGTLDLASGTGSITTLLAGGKVKETGSATTFANFGVLEVGTGAGFTVAGNGSIAAAQGLTVNGTLSEAGTLTVAGKLTTHGTVAGAGALALTGGADAFDTGTSLAIAKVVQSGGAASFNATSITVADVWTQTAASITVAAGDKVSFTGAGDSFAGTFSGAGTVAFTGGSDALTGASLKAASETINGAAATLSGAITLTGALSVTSPDLAIATAGATISGGGSLNLTNLATNAIKGVTSAATLTNGDKITGAGTISGLVLVNQASGIINGNQTTALVINTGTLAVTNAGLIESTSTGGLTIKGALANTGTLMVTNGTLDVTGAVSGAGIVKIGGGAADFGAGLAENVTFTSTAGVLKLAKSTAYAGAITGFSKTGTTSLDLTDVTFGGSTKATYSGTAASGVLTVTDGTHTAKIHLTGNYTASTFNVSSDGHGGTTVVDPTAPSDRTPPLLPLVTAMAGFGARTGEPGAAASQTSRDSPRLILSPRVMSA